MKNSFQQPGVVLLLMPFTIGSKTPIHEADFFDSHHSLCEYIKQQTKPCLHSKEPVYEYQQN